METRNDLSEYTHLPPEEDIGPTERSYRAEEKVLEYGDRKLLYLVVETTGVNFFCDRSATAHVGSIVVPGFIANWQTKRDPEGVPVSEVEPIRDAETQREVRRLLQGEHISNINFW